MKLSFTKMSGAGNDFVMIDNREGKFQLTSEQIAKICDRHFGVGADGILAVELGVDGADFRMRYMNADGSEVNMCGNGARCFARFVQPFIKKDQFNFMTRAGLIQARCTGEDVEINMTIPVDLEMHYSIALSTGSREVHSINTGVPHVVIFMDDLEEAPVFQMGREIRRHSHYAPNGTNVNFVKVTGAQNIEVRTYERGVEDETLACGTGVTASALIAHLVHRMPFPIAVKVKSGRTLRIDAQSHGGKFERVTMLGPAEFIFTGEIEI